MPFEKVVISLSSSSAEIGDLHIYDDGDQVTVIITGITHGDFGVYDENLNTEEKEQIITEDVISFVLAGQYQGAQSKEPWLLSAKIAIH